MASILSTLQTVLLSTWSLFDYQLLPGISLKAIFIFFCVAFICCEFFRLLSD